MNENFLQMQEGPKSVAAFFNGDKWGQYFPALKQKENAELLSELRSGEYNIAKHESTVTGKVFYLFSKGTVNKENPEMAFPFSVSAE